MPFFRCSICREDGSICAEGVTVSLEQTERDGTTQWYGTVSATQEVDLAAGQRYRLVLSDGRGGDFMVRRNTAADGASRAIAIQGIGPLK